MPRKTQPEKLDCYTKVVTPENIQFEYALAGPFQRLLAYLADVLIWNITFWGFAFLLILILGIFRLPSLIELGAFVGFIVYFLMSWFYGVFFEAYYNGKTPGKALFKLRTISIDGRPINGVQAGLRNLLRLADIYVLVSLQVLGDDAPMYNAFPTMIVGLITMVVSTRMQRIGDLAAGTMVISESRKYSPWNLQPEDLRAFGLAELIPLTFEVSSSMAQTVGLYMENRKRLGLARREEIAGKIAKPLIRRFELLPNTGCDLLLCAMYVRIFLSEAQQQQGMEAMRRSVDPNMRIMSQVAYPGSNAYNPGPQNAPVPYPGPQYPSPPSESTWNSAPQGYPQPLPPQAPLQQPSEFNPSHQQQVGQQSASSAQDQQSKSNQPFNF
ncbi:MAG: RDD family protein [Pirellulales bacterium]